MSRIKCTVEECVYHNDDRCEASEIEVSSCGSKNVKRSDDTACETFRNRGGSGSTMSSSTMSDSGDSGVSHTSSSSDSGFSRGRGGQGFS